MTKFKKNVILLIRSGILNWEIKRKIKKTSGSFLKDKRIKSILMFKKEQIENKINAVDKRSHNAPLTIVPTSMTTLQTLARFNFQRMKIKKNSWRTKEVYQLR